jgi:hypothetical protein
VTGCDFTVDGGARAKHWSFMPSTDEAIGPAALIPLDITAAGEA